MSGRSRPGAPSGGAVLVTAVGCTALAWLASRISITAAVVVFVAGLVVIAVLTSRPGNGGCCRPPAVSDHGPARGPALPPTSSPAPRPAVRGPRVPGPRGAAWPERGAWPPAWARIRRVPDTADELITAWVQIPGPHEDRRRELP